MKEAAKPRQASIKRREHFGKIAFVLAFVGLMCCALTGAAVNATSSRGEADLRLRKALAVTTDLESLVTLHIAANTDFLRGVGTAGYSSRGWPIARSAAAAGAYDRLEENLVDAPDRIVKVRQLRRLSAAWPRELDAAAMGVARAHAGVAEDPAALQRANETLSSIMTLLATLRNQERDQIAQMQFSAQAQLVREKVFLALATASGHSC